MKNLYLLPTGNVQNIASGKIGPLGASAATYQNATGYWIASDQDAVDFLNGFKSAGITVGGAAGGLTVIPVDTDAFAEITGSLGLDAGFTNFLRTNVPDVVSRAA